MFTLTDISLQRSGNWLFKNASLRINPGDRVGLLGRNGCGKTSLIKLLLGELESDSGDIHLPGNTVIASTEQETLASNRSALDHVIDGHNVLRKLQQQLKKAEETNNNKQLALVLQSLDAIDAYQIPITAAKLLSGLGFSVAQQQQSVKDFSGGWRMRLNLAKALICPSDLLLLDEPTNHLDLDAVFWLEDWLKNYKGTLLLISHDAVFLDSVVTHIAHVTEKTIELYTGNYSSFSKQRAQKLSLQHSMADRQKRQRQHLESFIDRFRAQATKAKQVQSRVKMLQKLEEITFARVASPVQFEFINTETPPNPLLYLKHTDMGYTDAILKDISLTLSPGSRIGLIGKNGTGKSTLIKTLGKQLATLSGEFYSADKLNLGYFSQHQLETLRSDESPLWHLQQLAKETREQTLRNFLGSFDFSGDKVTSPVAPLSGGEKARLCLALIIWNKPNLLLLDEPTNHLDLDTRTALTTAIQDFTGALIIVSHDRSLLESSCDEFWLIDSGKVVPFKGDLSDYKKWLFDSKNTSDNPKKIKNLSSVNHKQKKQQQALLRQKLSPLKKQLAVTETKITSLQEDQKTLESSLADNAIYSPENKLKLSEILQKQLKVNEELSTTENTWMELQETLDTLINEEF